MFGHSYDVLRLETPDHHERRSVEAAEMTYNPDGTINEVPYWRDATLDQIEWLNPYRRVEAETMAWGFGLKTKKNAEVGTYVTKIDDGDSLRVAGVNFDKGAKKFMALVATDKPGAEIELHLDSVDGPLIGTVKVVPGSSMDSYSEQVCEIKGAKGVHDLVFKFVNAENKNDFMNFDYWKFSK